MGPPVNEVERDAIAYLRGHLPNTYTIFHNLELRGNQIISEIDLVIIAPQCVFVVDIKGIHGTIEVFGSKWYPENRQPYYSPVAKLRQHCRVLNSLIRNSNYTNSQLGKVHIQPAVLLMSDDVELIDPSGKDDEVVIPCDRQGLQYFQSTDFIPDYRLQDISPYLSTVEQVIRGTARPKNPLPRYGKWQVSEKLGESDRYIDYRANHLSLKNLTTRLRVYPIDIYQDATARAEEKKLIHNAFETVYKLPLHQHILPLRDLLEGEDGDCVVIATDDIASHTLRQSIQQDHLTLTQKLDWIEQILTGLDHIHQNQVIHRHLTPDTLLIDADQQIRITGFDYARVRDRTTTIANDIIEDLNEDAAYQAIECYRDPQKASIASDLFAAGLIFYELLTGKQAFANAEEICDRAAQFPQPPSHLNPDLPPGLDEWLQTLCAFEPQHRFTHAETALQQLSALRTPQPPPEVNPHLPLDDLTDLPPKTCLDGRYTIQHRLGKPGNFAVAYKVDDEWGKETVVLKLVTRDRYSVYDRLRQEYQTLKQIAHHPYIVPVSWAGELKDGTPFITFKYIEGEDLATLLAKQKFTIEQSLKIAQQTVSAIDHLHQNSIYHQDIKPSNLLWTKDGIRLIDFNIAISEESQEGVSAGTRRYLPPDYQLTPTPTR
ncbi:NERD domain-containing serine/threonine-protein kinase, partial [Spirulina sp. CS-785/01]|uniref:methylation-associated defense system protein kinase MAD6 n=1 Tax=Spirulina sp. CS-785/01 TaxID=3021716 RepID=UPI00232D34A4